MGPAKFHDGVEVDYQRSRSSATTRVINGPRPSPLKLSKDSHVIHKPYSSSSSAAGPLSLAQQRQPMIIYVHSPKVIHTQPRDFMALVQKLTGLSRTDDDAEGAGTTGKKKKNSKMGHEDNDSSSVLTDDQKHNHGGAGVGDGDGVDLPSVSPITRPPTNPFLADIPLFTPTSNDFFCSPKLMFRFSDSVFANSPSTGNSISPSVFEFIKGLPE